MHTPGPCAFCKEAWLLGPKGPSPSAGDLRELPRVPLRGAGSCGGGGAPRDIINAGEGVEKREPSYTVGGNAN